MVQGVDVLAHDGSAQGRRTFEVDEEEVGDLWECRAHWPQVQEQGILDHHIRADQGTYHGGLHKDKWTWEYLLTFWSLRLSTVRGAGALARPHSQFEGILALVESVHPNDEEDWHSTPHAGT